MRSLRPIIPDRRRATRLAADRSASTAGLTTPSRWHTMSLQQVDPYLSFYIVGSLAKMVVVTSAGSAPASPTITAGTPVPEARPI